MLGRTDFSSEAEYYRHHNKVMKLAIERGCTPREAEQWMRECERREEHRARCKRRGFESKLPPMPKAPKTETANNPIKDWATPHMMRD